MRKSRRKCKHERRSFARLHVGRRRDLADDDPLFEERELDIAAGADERHPASAEVPI